MAGGQSLRLSTDNEQNLYNLAHCFVGGLRLSPTSRERQGGVKVGLMNERIGKSATTTEHLEARDIGDAEFLTLSTLRG